ncbi:MAG TPA: hypothetical protein VIF82_05785 [Burkholderiaceae bacterium]|jgi:hypothetical protein
MVILELKALLDLFDEHVPDRESNRLVWKLCDNRKKWMEAHDLHSVLRERNLIAIKEGDKVRECQYCFEEVVAATLFNLTYPEAPFDPDTPYWIIKNALALAKKVGIPVEAVAGIVAPNTAVNTESLSAPRLP